MQSLCLYCKAIPSSFFLQPCKISRIDIPQSANPECEKNVQGGIYWHHPSHESLDLAASLGCELCRLIKACHTGMIAEESIPVEEHPPSGCLSLRHDVVHDLESIEVVTGPREQTYAKFGYHIAPLSWKETDASLSGVDFVKAWLRTCDYEHIECKARTPPYVPVRLIDVGLSDGSQSPRLVISTTPSTLEDEGRYLALSYCWGNTMPEPLKTTSDNLDIRTTHGIPLEMFPLTLSDAIKFTRALGIRYIWIDALCIIQNSKEDWEAESAKMSLVYNHAYCTLAASASADTDAGFPTHAFQSNHLSDNRSLIFEPTDSTSQNRVRVGITWMGGTTSHRWRMQWESLQRRGWALQERHLSRRIAYISEEFIFWECKHARSSSVFPWPTWSPSTTDHMRLFDGRQDTLKERMTYLTWQILIWEYTSRDLTFQADKFPAIAGLVAEFQALTQDQYLAGIWRNTLPASLCWKSVPAMAMSAKSRAFTHQRAPSWSWASVDQQVCMDHESMDKLEILVTVIEARTTPGTHEVLGQTYNGHLKIHGRIKSVVIVAVPKEGFETQRPHNTELYDPVDKTLCIGFGFLEVDPREFTPRQEIRCLALVRNIGVHYNAEDLPPGIWQSNNSKVSPLVTAIVLTSTGRNGEYYRIGLAEILLESAFEDCEASTIIII